MIKEFDTIAAVATAMGESGISIIRVSGSDALKIVSSIFEGRNGRKLDDIKTYSMRYGNIVEKETREPIDEVIVSYMKGPRSFTAEDCVEVNCHGGYICTNRVLQEVIKAGARSAEPGEFTKRAFLNGRIDLSQAEAVMDIITAKTELSQKSALAQSGGRISKKINSLRERILAMIAHIEATVDYPEDDMEQATSESVSKELKEILKEMQHILSTADEGKILREGLKMVIVGKPNVGKSSLLNSMLMEKRAIVTDVPGTTRDVIEEYINLDGVPVKIIDTAGIRDTDDIVEQIGVEKSREKIEEADVVVLILDLSRELEDEDKEIMEMVKDKKHIVLLNKCDLERKLPEECLKGFDNIIEISAMNGYGIDKLKETVKNMFFSGEIKAAEVLLTNGRHKEAVYKAKERCEAALKTLDMGLAIDLASIDLRSAWMNLGEITGDTMEEDLIDKIFSEFCLGK